jgi:hypothetical protein
MGENYHSKKSYNTGPRLKLTILTTHVGSLPRGHPGDHLWDLLRRGRPTQSDAAGNAQQEDAGNGGRS